MATDMHADAVGLHHCSVAVDINNETWETVAFTVDETEHCVVVTYETEALTHKVSLAETALPEDAVYCFFFEREDADGDAADLVVADGDELVLRLAFRLGDGFEDVDEVAFFELLVFFADDFVDGSAEDPGVVSAETF